MSVSALNCVNVGLLSIEKHSSEQKLDSNRSQKVGFLMMVTSDEFEPSWLEPQLELKDFQLGSARLVTFFSQLEIENQPKTSRNFDFVFLNDYFIRIGLKLD